MTIDEQWHNDVDRLLAAFTHVGELVEAGLLQEAMHLMTSALRDQQALDPRVHQIYLTTMQVLNIVGGMLLTQERELTILRQEVETHSLQLANLNRDRTYLLAYAEHQSVQLMEILRWSLETRMAVNTDFTRTFATPLVNYIEGLLESLRPTLGKVAIEVEVALNPLKSYLNTLRPSTLSVAVEDIPLSPREIQVLQHLTRGLSATEIGELLHIEASTIRTYRRRIMQKLDIHHLPGLVKYALRHNLTTIDS